MSKYEIGTPVLVFDVDGKVLGLGKLVSFEDVDIEDDETGEIIGTIPSIPVIELTDGRKLYGFECFWKPLSDPSLYRGVTEPPKTIEEVRKKAEIINKHLKEKYGSFENLVERIKAEIPDDEQISLLNDEVKSEKSEMLWDLLRWDIMRTILSIQSDE